MPDAKMNQKWWTGNKAKTLLDSGDTMLKALVAWDAAKAGTDPDKVEAALVKVGAAATALKAKANKTLHKETIGYLQTYIDNAKEAISAMKKADGTNLANNLQNIPKPIFKRLQAIDATFWNSHSENLEFLALMKSGKGSLDIYKKYIAAGADLQVNLPEPQRAACQAAVAAEEWDAPAWMTAVKSIKTMMTANKMGALERCGVVAKRLQIEELRTI